jgi:aspartyl-tRNA(Asn)/glutamyl-tRNA(Gln) amidotransferase subunit A
MTVPADPFVSGIAAVAQDVRAGKTTFLELTERCLQRIEAFDASLNAFQLVCAERAIATATGLDQLLAGGTDLGPLMGIPVAIKDIVAVDGMPTTNGSLYRPEHLQLAQGAVVDRLQRAGCVVIGKTKTVEFALGATGVNHARGTPWNAWDSHEQRIPGGSSSGSAVATAAGLCGFAIGTDTGGSVRIPACFNGLFGHKTTVGLWPTNGVFALSPTLDSIGPLCRTAADASLVHEVICGEAVTPAASLAGLRIGVPSTVNLDDLDAEVAMAFELARRRLADYGVQLTDIDVPENHERAEIFPPLVGAEIINSLTREGFEAARDQMDPVTAARAGVGLNVDAVSYLAAKQRHRELVQIGSDYLTELDGWVTPTCPMLPMTLDSLQQPDMHERSLLASRNTQMINLYGQCAVSMPIQQLTEAARLPIGLQLVMRGGQDARLLSVSQAMESVLGNGGAPDLTGFTSS